MFRYGPMLQHNSNERRKRLNGKNAHRHRHPEDRAAVRRLRRSRSLTLNRTAKTVQPFRKIVSGSDARVYVYFDDTVIGDVSNVELVDTDGDVVASAGDRVFTKTQGKGLYVAFKYNIKEMEVESSDEAV